ncbi:MAG: peptidylprolyl isomerase [Rhodospirillales bacterium]
MTFVSIRRLVLSAVLAAATSFVTTAESHAQATDTLRIAAVVNEEVVSAYDLGNRIRMVIALSNLPNRPEVQRQLAPQILRSLIDERLRLQEAESMGIEVDPARVDQALASVAERNNMSVEQLMSEFDRRNLDPDTLVQQLKAEIAWSQTIFSRYSQLANVTDAEIDAAVREAEESLGKPEYNIAEIFLSENATDSPAEIRRQATRLVQQLRQGASFPALAQSFSQLPTASNGGAIGWVRPDQLSDEVAQRVTRMSPGSVSDPIPVTGGIYIIMLRNTRIAGQQVVGKTTVSLSQLHLSLPSDAPQDTVNSYIRSARDRSTSVGTCAEFEELGRNFGSPVSGSLGTIELEKLPLPIRKAVDPLKVHEITPPIRMQDAVVVLMVCDRTDPKVETVEIDREDIRRQLINRRLDNFARRHMRDLYRNAFIDIRT